MLGYRINEVPSSGVDEVAGGTSGDGFWEGDKVYAINDWNAAGQYSPRQTLVFLPTFARVSKVTKPGTDELPFEDALNRLESIVESMESDDLPLEQLLTRFEEGARLSRLCQQRLADAEVKIQKLEQDLSGDLTLKPMAVASED
jgi:exodeoxyribonuclease VII small subunit